MLITYRKKRLLRAGLNSMRRDGQEEGEGSLKITPNRQLKEGLQSTCDTSCCKPPPARSFEISWQYDLVLNSDIFLCAIIASLGGFFFLFVFLSQQG